MKKGAMFVIVIALMILAGETIVYLSRRSEENIRQQDLEAKFASQEAVSREPEVSSIADTSDSDFLNIPPDISDEGAPSEAPEWFIAMQGGETSQASTIDPGVANERPPNMLEEKTSEELSSGSIDSSPSINSYGDALAYLEALDAEGREPMKNQSEDPYSEYISTIFESPIHAKNRAAEILGQDSIEVSDIAMEDLTRIEWFRIAKELNYMELNSDLELDMFLGSIETVGLVNSLNETGVFYLTGNVDAYPQNASSFSVLKSEGKWVPLEIWYGNEGLFYGFNQAIFDRLSKLNFEFDEFRVYRANLKNIVWFSIYEDVRGHTFIVFLQGEQGLHLDPVKIYNTTEFIKLLEDNRNLITYTELGGGVIME